MTQHRPFRAFFTLVGLALSLALPQARAADAVALVFADPARIEVAVTTMDVRNEDASPTSYPYVTNRAPVTYEQAVRAWAAQRFALGGGTVNTLRITLKRGAITEKLLPISKGIAGWFKKEQNAEYTGALEVDIAIVDPNGQVLTVVNGKSWAAETIREDATTTDRAETWLRLVKKTFDNLDADVVPRMRTTMTAYVK